MSSSEQVRGPDGDDGNDHLDDFEDDCDSEHDDDNAYDRDNFDNYYYFADCHDDSLSQPG